MKLQFKTEALLKKIEGLIIKDITARKEHNRKVDIIKKEVDVYLKNKKQRHQLEIEKANKILGGYSDEDLKSLFLQAHYVVKQGLFWNTIREGLKPIEDVVELGGLGFKTKRGYFDNRKILRSIPYKGLYLTWVSEEYYYEDETIDLICSDVQEVEKIVTPNKLSTEGRADLQSLKARCLLAKEQGIEECTLEEDDLTLLDSSRNMDKYKLTAGNGLNSLSDYITRVHWSDVVNMSDLG